MQNNNNYYRTTTCKIFTMDLEVTLSRKCEISGSLNYAKKMKYCFFFFLLELGRELSLARAEEAEVLDRSLFLTRLF